MRNFTASIIVGIIVSGCTAAPSDPTKGQVILQCHGELVTSFGGGKPTSRSLRIDGTKGTVESWNDEAKKFSGIGDTDLSITQNNITASSLLTSSGDGLIVSVITNINIDRGSGAIVYKQKVLPFGGSVFKGECDPVAEVQESPRKF